MTSLTLNGPGTLADGKYPLGIVYTIEDTPLVVDSYHKKVQEFDIGKKYLI